MRLASTIFDTPVGRLTAVADEQALRLLEYDQPGRVDEQLQRLTTALGAEVTRGKAAPLEDAEQQLAEYFAGERSVFDLNLAPVGTPFEQEVWRALREIKAGQTRSYATIARSIGRPTATRAVGRANGRNPISIVVPCHRVIGADGTLTGYGGGLQRKRWLLEHERRFNREALFA